MLRVSVRTGCQICHLEGLSDYTLVRKHEGWKMETKRLFRRLVRLPRQLGIVAQIRVMTQRWGQEHPDLVKTLIYNSG